MIPKWTDKMSDGCTGALLLDKTPGAHLCCLQHDKAYYYGGSEQDRQIADATLRADLVKAGVPEWRAEVVYQIVRVTGAPWLHLPWSWAFGGKVFRYTEEPNG